MPKTDKELLSMCRAALKSISFQGYEVPKGVADKALAILDEAEKDVQNNPTQASQPS